MKAKQTFLGQTKNRTDLDILKNVAFNLLGIHIYTVITGHTDTVFNYEIYADLTKKRELEVKSFVLGFLAAKNN